VRGAGVGAALEMAHLLDRQIREQIPWLINGFYPVDTTLPRPDPDGDGPVVIRTLHTAVESLREIVQCLRHGHFEAAAHRAVRVTGMLLDGQDRGVLDDRLSSVARDLVIACTELDVRARASSVPQPVPSAWWASRWVGVAVRIVPAEERPRYGEEWRGELREIAAARRGRRGQLAYAVRLVASAWGVRRAVRQGRFSAVGSG
jgi:hypothetical protein